MKEIETIFAPDAPPANGHYSHACVFNGLVFTAVQLPIDPANGRDTLPSVEQQARQVLSNIDACLRAGGSSLNAALRIMIYVTDIALWPEVNKIYSEVLGDHKPARGVVAVASLHLGYQIAMEAIGAAIEFS